MSADLESRVKRLESLSMLNDLMPEEVREHMRTRTKERRDRMKPVMVIFHANCWDGFCAAWLFGRAIPDAVFLPATYGEPPPTAEDVADRPHVYIVDFSYKRKEMGDLIAATDGKLTVLDHHKTAEEELRDIHDGNASGVLNDCPQIIFDMTKSGARLAWEFLWDKRLLGANFMANYAREKPPWLVAYVEDRDLWAWKLPNSKEVNAGLRTYPMDAKVWDQFERLDPAFINVIGDQGAAVLRLQDQIVVAHLKHAVEIEIAGHKVKSVNATVFNSEIAGELAKDQPFGVCWFEGPTGKRHWSLRSSDGGIDVSEIAKKYGGGGHKAAAGFQTEAPHNLEVVSAL